MEDLHPAATFGLAVWLSLRDGVPPRWPWWNLMSGWNPYWKVHHSEEIDFLQNGTRKAGASLHMRRQYAALIVLFLVL